MCKKFTLIELLVVVAIIGILASLLLPALGRAKFKSKLVVCKSNLGQIAKATLQYTIDYDQFYPEGTRPSNFPDTAVTSRPSVQYQVQTSEFGTYLTDKPSYGNFWEEEVFVCPQGKKEVGWYAKTSAASTAKRSPGGRTVWHSAAGRSFYNMYFDCEFGFRKPMQKVNDRFIINNGGNQEFNIIASDVYKRLGIAHASNTASGDMSNHIWSGNRNYPWDDRGAAHFSYGPLYFNSSTGKTFANFAFDDGSVLQWNNDATVSGESVRASSSAASRSFDLPEEFIVD